MEIYTKYNLGDKVVILRNDGTAAAMLIDRITISVGEPASGDDGPQVDVVYQGYNNQHDGKWSCHKSEKDCFDSLDGLIQHIRKNFVTYDD